MKRLVCFVFAVLMAAAMLPAGAQAAEQTEETVRYVYYEDGSYLKVTVTVTESQSRALDKVAGSKKFEYTGSNGEVCWSAVLKGNFTYDGSIAVCTSSSCDVTINKDSYYLLSKDVGKRSNYAYATVVIGRELLGVAFGEETYELTLYCDKNGNLS